MFEFISENKDWLFSGAGISVFTIIYFKYRAYKKNNECLNDDSNLVDCYRYIPCFVLKKAFPHSRFIHSVRLDVRQHGEAVNLNLGELPECEVWLQVINHSPFSLDVESIKGVLNYDGCSIDVESAHHIDLEKHTTSDSVLLKGKLTGAQAEHCSKDADQKNASLVLRSRIRTKFALFKKDSYDIRDLHVRIMNKRKV
ncbi:MAG: hypothetical protein KAT25_03675 [Sulfuriflexus sp.]|nr:hypothetical protein [Sulfuriflexus sp.]